MIISYTESLAILNVRPDFTAEQLKMAYRKAAHKHHPDKGGHAEKFNQVRQAYEFLQKYQAEPVNNHSVNVGFSTNYNGGFTITYYF